MFMAIKQRGHNPVGELGGSGVPHCGQTGVDTVLIPDTYRSPPVAYTIKRFSRNMLLTNDSGGTRRAATNERRVQRRNAFPAWHADHSAAARGGVVAARPPLPPAWFVKDMNPDLH